MKQELDRVKNDVETIQKALGLGPAIRREWVQWLNRDKWQPLWLCLPGGILVLSPLLPLGDKERYFGLVPAQWVGLLVAATLLAVTIHYFRKLNARDGRPESLIREYKRINGNGFWLSAAMLAGFALYFIWGRRSGIPAKAFWSGLWIFAGSSLLLAAVASRLWYGLGWAIPFLAYGLFETLAPNTGKIGAVPLGLMFIAAALLFSLFHGRMVRTVECQNESH